MFKEISALLILGTLSVMARNENHESHYQRIAAKQLGGKMEYVLKDKTRVDILTEDVAYEVDFAVKWAEGIGQALHYSTMTKRDAGLILIIEKETDERYVQRVLHIMKIKSLRLILYTYDNRTGILSRVRK